MGKLFGKVILIIVQSHLEEKDLLNVSPFAFVDVTARHFNAWVYMLRDLKFE
jgi:hypothetical protein